MPTRAVVFDVGETLVDESRHWGDWADWLGVTRFTLFGALGAVIARGGHHHEVFRMVSPGFDLEAANRERHAAGWRYQLARSDFYPDAMDCLTALKSRGYRIGIVGNQPAAAEASLRECGVAADFIATSAAWGVEKPSPAFFAKLAEAAGVPPAEIAYVGDRIDNDVAPARAAGMTAVFIRRGPWAVIQEQTLGVGDAHIVLQSLSELIDKLADR